MDVGDLKFFDRQFGGETIDGKDLKRCTFSGLFWSIKKDDGIGPGKLQKQMSSPIKQQMVMQRGGFLW